MLQIYKASAGSGKTYKLAYEYIRSLLGYKSADSYRLCLPKYISGAVDLNNRHRYILAITFTNKATEEMKRRIIDELDALSSMPKPGSKDANYAADLCKEYGCTRQELADVAHRALHQLLHDYGSMHVTTIDSFFQRVLRTFARELDRQGDFNVELNDTTAVQTAIGTMLDDFNAEPASHPLIGRWIYNYMCRQIDEGKKANIFNRRSQIFTNLVELLSKICEEQFKPYSTEMQTALSDPTAMQKLKESITALRHNILADIKDDSQRTWAELGSHGTTIDKINGSLKKLPKLMRDSLLRGTAAPNISEDIFNDTYTKMLNGTSRTKIFPKTSKVPDADNKTILSLLERIRTQYANYQILGDIYHNIDQLILLGYTWQYLNDLIVENNIVLLSDTNHLLNCIIGKDETPFIYERMGVEYRHFLIDEFQDTSRMQWENLKPLVANGLDGDYDSLIIGDEKQSIYRFRNSDTTLLHTKVANIDFPTPAYDTRVGGDGDGENTNYRSAREVVIFNNTVFVNLAKRMAIRGYGNVVQNIAERHNELAGYVKFVPTPAPKDKKDNADVEPALDVIPQEDDALDKMAKEIQRQHEQGHYPWGEIAILVATNQEATRAVERLITTYPQIPVLSDEAMYVRKSPAVLLVVSALEIIANMDDRPKHKKKAKYYTNAEVAVAISRFGYYNSKGMAADQAIELALSEKADTADELPTELIAAIDAIKEQKPASLIGLVETVINRLVPETERQTQIAYLTALQDHVLDYCAHNNQSLRAFLTHWETTKQTLTISSAANVDAVKVMTIHKSKGLEFACVHIPYGSWEEIKKAGGQWLKFPDIPGLSAEARPPAVYLDFSTNTKSYATKGSYYYDEYKADEAERYIDTMNLTYVAYTRAGRELIVYYDPGKGIGARLAELFSDITQSTKVKRADGTVSDDPRLCRLSDYYDPVTHGFEMGRPTVDVLHKQEEAGGVHICRIDEYKVYNHDGAKVLTSVEDILGLSTDITDDVMTEHEADKYEADDTGRKRGMILHAALSQIVNLDDMMAAVARTQRNLRLVESQAAELTANLTAMLNPQDARIRRWFVDNDGVYTEQTIYIGHDNKRPDRIVLNTDGTVEVIDYKFTKTDDVPQSHRRQVEGYVDLLHAMGYANVRGYLWYPFIPRIVEV